MQEIHPRYRNLKKNNHMRFLCDFFSIPFHFIYDMNNIDNKITFLNEHLLNVFDWNASFTEFRITKKPAPWLTDNLHFLIKLRDKALAPYRVSKENQKWLYYKTLRNMANAAAVREKTAYLKHRLALSGRPGCTFRELGNMGAGFKRRPCRLPGHLARIPSRKFQPDQELVAKYLNKRLGEEKIQLLFVNEDEATKIIHSITSNACNWS